MLLYRFRQILCAPFLIASICVGLILSLFSPFNPRVMILTSRMISNIVCFFFNIEYEIRGKHHLDNCTPCIFISNHQSNIDVILGGLFAPWKTVSFGKKQILYIPIYGLFYWLSGNILIDRAKKHRALDILNNKVVHALKKGTSIWILPEGTRSYNKGLLPFKRGAFRTVINAQVPLVPIIMSPQHTTVDFTKWKSGKIIVEIHPPIETKGMSLDKDRELCQTTWNLYKERLPVLEKEITNSDHNAQINEPLSC